LVVPRHRPSFVPLLSHSNINKDFKSDFVDGKRSRGRLKNSWKEAVDKDSIALGIGNWQTVASDRARFKRRLREIMDHDLDG